MSVRAHFGDMDLAAGPSSDRRVGVVFDRVVATPPVRLPLRQRLWSRRDELAMVPSLSSWAVHPITLRSFRRLINNTSDLVEVYTLYGDEMAESVDKWLETWGLTPNRVIGFGAPLLLGEYVRMNTSIHTVYVNGEDFVTLAAIGYVAKGVPENGELQ